MSTFGHIIKFERIRQNIKQVQLSDGICTPSYLSKIESNSIVPSEEILGELFERLSIKTSQIDMSEEQYLHKVREAYFDLINNKDRGKAALALSKFSSEGFLFLNPTFYYSYLLMFFRLKVLASYIEEDTLLYLSTITKFSSEFNTYQLFQLHTCIGYYHFNKLEYDSTLQAFEKAKEYLKTCTVKESELADFHYLIGLISLHLGKFIASLEYLNKALEYFTKEFIYNRAAECYLSISIIYKNTMKLSKSEENLLLAAKLSKLSKVKDDYLLSIIYFNLASNYSINNDHKRATQAYIKSLSLTDDQTLKIRHIYSIVLENSIMSNVEEVIKWCRKGLEIYEEDPSVEREPYYLHLKQYLTDYTKSDDYSANLQSLIHYFEKLKDFRHAHKYTLKLASFFYNEKKYKKATQCYAKAERFLALKEKRNSLEEI